MSLLSTIQRVTRVLSLATPTAVVSSTDKQILQLWELANEEGEDLARAYNWQALTFEWEFNTVTADAQAAAIADDFDRFLSNSFFNRTTRRPMTGPITARQWQWIKAQPVYSTVYLAFRERTGQFLVAPQPAAGNQVFYEYVSENWVQPTGGGDPQPLYAADTDVAILDERLIWRGIRWRFLKAKGLDYSEEMETYERMKAQSMARDGGNSMLSLAPQPVDPNRVNLPDGSFGV